MFSLIEQVFIVFLSFSESLARDWRKCLFLSYEPCMVRPTFIDMNPVELKYYPFVIGLNKCTGSCNVLSRKVCVPRETENVNIEAFNLITLKKQAKTMTEHISCHCKCKINSVICNSN